jgi:hypothetical protein
VSEIYRERKKSWLLESVWPWVCVLPSLCFYFIIY